MKRLVILTAALALFPVTPAFAQHEGMDMAGMSAKTAMTEGVGVVDSVDQARGIVTLSHEPIASLNWPAMTMDFAVDDKALFKKLIVGKTVKFQFVKQGNRYVVKGAK